MSTKTKTQLSAEVKELRALVKLQKRQLEQEQVTTALLSAILGAVNAQLILSHPQMIDHMSSASDTEAAARRQIRESAKGGRY